MTSNSQQPLRIAYAIQNVGGIDFSLDIGDGVPVKYTLRGLRKAGYDITCFKLAGNKVIGIDDITNLAQTRRLTSGLTATKPFRLFESGIRRIQKQLKIPYFAFFDTFRFYETCVRSLPNYDLCHEHNGLFCVGAALACKRLKKPYVLTFSADPLLELKLVGKPLKGIHAAIAAWGSNLTYKLADKIICVSKPAKQHLIDNWKVPAEKIVVMPNGVDAEVFKGCDDPTDIRTELGVHNDPTIGFVGGFQLWHGLEQFVVCFAQMLEKIPNAKLLLVGDGPVRPLIEKKIREFNVESSVIITGLVPQVVVPKMLAAIDVAVLPYPELPQELWFSPLKLYEYMAAEKAIVASRSGQIAEVIREGVSGILVEPGDLESLSNAIVRLLQSPEERKQLGQNARKQAIQQHSWEQYIKCLEEIYYSVI